MATYISHGAQNRGIQILAENTGRNEHMQTGLRNPWK